MAKSLTAAERETIIVTSDADKYWLISTHQKPRVSQLERLVEAGFAEKLEDLSWGNQAGGQYKVASNMITIRNSSKKRKMARPDAPSCKGLTSTGKSCNMFATDNGYCRHHQDQAKPKRVRARKKR